MKSLLRNSWTKWKVFISYIYRTTKLKSKKFEPHISHERLWSYSDWLKEFFLFRISFRSTILHIRSRQMMKHKSMKWFGASRLVCISFFRPKCQLLSLYDLLAQTFTGSMKSGSLLNIRFMNCKNRLWQETSLWSYPVIVVYILLMLRN